MMLSLFSLAVLLQEQVYLFWTSINQSCIFETSYIYKHISRISHKLQVVSQLHMAIISIKMLIKFT